MIVNINLQFNFMLLEVNVKNADLIILPRLEA